MEFIKELENIDWNFKRYRQKGIDNIHWFPANFIPQIPSILIANLSEPNSVILDPFCGSGTTLVESVRLGRIGIGVDINPLAYLISKVKLTYIDPSLLEQLKKKYRTVLTERAKKPVLIPDFPNKECWFHKNTLNELGTIFYIINKENDRDVKDLLFVCFSAILKKCCSQRDHYTYVADNMYPKNGMSLVHIDANAVFLEQLDKTVNTIMSFYRSMEIQGINTMRLLSQCIIKKEDSRLLQSVDNDAIDLIVTSPPYANVTDYTTGNRLSFYWFGLGGLRENKELEIGARWKRQRKTALEDYMRDMKQSFKQLRRVLKKGGFFCYVLGESSSISKKFELDRKLIDILKTELEFKILSEKIERNIFAKRIRSVKGVDKEHIRIFQKI